VLLHLQHRQHTACAQQQAGHKAGYVEAAAMGTHYFKGSDRCGAIWCTCRGCGHCVTPARCALLAKSPPAAGLA